MVLVTDKNYFLERDMMCNLDFCIERLERGWDNCIIIDGDERSGKSTVGRQIGYYVSYQTKTSFTHENIFFDPELMFEYASTKKHRVIIWDEAALGGLSDDRYNEVQQLLIRMLMVCGKYGHTFIFIIPKIRKLCDYLAEDRSIGLIRVYSPDNLNRGFYKVFDKKKKYLVSQIERKKLSHRIFPNFRGRFYSYENDTTREVIDINAYEKAKDDAILNIKYTKKSAQRMAICLRKLVDHLSLAKILTKKRVAEIIGKDASFLSRLPQK